MPDHAMAPSPAGSLLVIGAGRADDLEHWCADLAAPDAPVVLIEPDPAAMADLERRLAGRPGLTLLPVALGAEAGEGELRIFNMPGLASLQAPTGLKDLLPGLRELRRVAVPVRSVAEVLEGLGPLPDPLHLRLAAPGAEGVILDGLARAGLLARAARVDLRCGAEPLFEGATDLAGVQTLMQAEGLVATGLDLSDPDWPQATFVPGALPAPRQLQARLTEAAAEAQAATARAEALAETLASREEDFKALTDKAAWRYKRIAELEAALKDQANEIKALTAEQSRISDALGQAQVALANAQETLASRDEDFKALTDKAAWRYKRIAELEAALKDQSSAAQTERSQIQTALERAQAALATAETRAARHGSEQEAQEARLVRLQAGLHEMEAALEQRTAEARAAQAEQRRLTTELGALEAALAGHDAALRDAEARASALQEALVGREAELKALEDKAAWRQKRIAELEAEASARPAAGLPAQQREVELEQRLTLARNELRRAEGQIELIKDLLLRGESL